MPNETPPASLSFRRPEWRVMTPMGLALALSLLGDATLYTVLPTHTAQAGIALASVGIILSVNRAVRLLINTPVGLAYDRWPRRWIFVPAAAVGVLSTALYALSPGFWPLLLGRLLWGLAWSGMWVGAQTIALDVAGPGQRGRLMGVAQAWFFLGGALSFFVGGLLTDRLGYREALWVGTAISAVGMLAALLFLPETRPAGAVPSGRLRWRLPRWSNLKPHLGAGGWAALYAQGVLRFSVAGVATATLVLFVEDTLGATVTLAGVAVGAATLTGLLLALRPLLSLATAPTAGRLSDIHGRWRMLNWGGVLGGASFLVLMAGSLLALLVNGVSERAVDGDPEPGVQRAGRRRLAGGDAGPQSGLAGQRGRPGQRAGAIGCLRLAAGCRSRRALPAVRGADVERRAGIANRQASQHDANPTKLLRPLRCAIMARSSIRDYDGSCC